MTSSLSQQLDGWAVGQLGQLGGCLSDVKSHGQIGSSRFSVTGRKTYAWMTSPVGRCYSTIVTFRTGSLGLQQGRGT